MFGYGNLPPGGLMGVDCDDRSDEDCGDEEPTRTPAEDEANRLAALAEIASWRAKGLVK